MHVICARDLYTYMQWFCRVLDRAGTVLQTPVATANGARTQFFLSLNAASIQSVTVIKTMAGHSNLSVTWIHLKGHATE